MKVLEGCTSHERKPATLQCRPGGSPRLRPTVKAVVGPGEAFLADSGRSQPERLAGLLDHLGVLEAADG